MYSKKNSEIEETKKYLESLKEYKKLNDSESNTCEGEITVDECTDAIFKMKLNKAPGLDGLNVEFYRAFWEELKTFIVATFNYCYEKGKLSNTQKVGLISLIYKKK